MIDYRSHYASEGHENFSNPSSWYHSPFAVRRRRALWRHGFVLPLDSGRKAIVVIDIAGHGLARAPLSSAIAERSAKRFVATHRHRCTPGCGRAAADLRG